MDTKKYVITSVVVFIVYQILSFIIHDILLKSPFLSTWLSNGLSSASSSL